MAELPPRRHGQLAHPQPQRLGQPAESCHPPDRRADRAGRAFARLPCGRVVGGARAAARGRQGGRRAARRPSGSRQRPGRSASVQLRPLGARGAPLPQPAGEQPRRPVYQPRSRLSPRQLLGRGPCRCGPRGPYQCRFGPGRLAVRTKAAGAIARRRGTDWRGRTLSPCPAARPFPRLAPRSDRVAVRRVSR